MLTKLLASGHYLMVVPVIGCLLLTLAVVIMGVGSFVSSSYSSYGCVGSGF